MLEAVIAALLPAAADGVRALIRRFAGGNVDPSEPQTPAERLEANKADTSRLEALAKLDTIYGTPSQWVIDLRGAFRYVLACFVLLCTFSILAYLTYANPDLRPFISSALFDMARVVFFFAFGDRVYRTFREKP